MLPAPGRCRPTTVPTGARSLALDLPTGMFAFQRHLSDTAPCRREPLVKLPCWASFCPGPPNLSHLFSGWLPRPWVLLPLAWDRSTEAPARAATFVLHTCSGCRWPHEGWNQDSLAMSCRKATHGACAIAQSARRRCAMGRQSSGQCIVTTRISQHASPGPNPATTPSVLSAGIEGQSISTSSVLAGLD